MLALSKIGTLEKKIKTNIVKNMLLFEKFPEVLLSQMADILKDAVVESAVLACDSHPKIGKAEFTVLTMKFGNNKVMKEAVFYLEKKISKMIDFDQQKSSFAEKKSIFTDLILHMSSEKDLVRDAQVEQLEIAINENIISEKKRIAKARAAKPEPTVFKTELEVLQIEKCYADALALVAPTVSTKGLSALEYCTMCIYYDSQPYPAQFLIMDEEENEGPVEEGLD